MSNLLSLLALGSAADQDAQAGHGYGEGPLTQNLLSQIADVRRKSSGPVATAPKPSPYMNPIPPQPQPPPFSVPGNDSPMQGYQQQTFTSGGHEVVSGRPIYKHDTYLMPIPQDQPPVNIPNIPYTQFSGYDTPGGRPRSQNVNERDIIGAAGVYPQFTPPPPDTRQPIHVGSIEDKFVYPPQAHQLPEEEYNPDFPIGGKQAKADMLPGRAQLIQRVLGDPNSKPQDKQAAQDEMESHINFIKGSPAGTVIDQWYNGQYKDEAEKQARLHQIVQRAQSNRAGKVMLAPGQFTRRSVLADALKAYEIYTYGK